MAAHCSHRPSRVAFFNRSVRKMPRSRALCLKSRGNCGLSRHTLIFARKKMTRALALLFAALTMLSGAGPAQAEFFDMRDLMGGGPSFRCGGGCGRGSPIARGTVSYPANYAPGTIVI